MSSIKEFKFVKSNLIKLTDCVINKLLNFSDLFINPHSCLIAQLKNCKIGFHLHTPNLEGTFTASATSPTIIRFCNDSCSTVVVVHFGDDH